MTDCITLEDSKAINFYWRGGRKQGTLVSQLLCSASFYTVYDATNSIGLAPSLQNAGLCMLSDSEGLLYLTTPAQSGNMIGYPISITGNSLSIGSQIDFDSTEMGGGGCNPAIKRLSDTRAFGINYEPVNDTYVAFLMSRSGSAYSVLDYENVIANSSASSHRALGLAILSETKAVVLYMKQGLGLFAKVVTISGDTFTLGAELDLGEASVTDMPIFSAVLSETEIIVPAGNPHGCAVLLTVTGTTIANTNKLVLFTNKPISSPDLSIEAVNNTHAVMTFTAPANDIKYCVIKNTSGTLSKHSEKALKPSGEGAAQIHWTISNTANLSPTRTVAFMHNNLSTSRMTELFTFLVNGDEVSLESTEEFGIRGVPSLFPTIAVLPSKAGLVTHSAPLNANPRPSDMKLLKL